MSSVGLPDFVQREASFAVPVAGQSCKTWYRVSGDLRSGTRPLVVLHGGPGCIGHGRSTHLPEKNGDTDFWAVNLFVDELHKPLDHLGIHDDYDLLGQSWGGVLASVFATQRPKRLHKLVIVDSPTSMKLWMEAAALLRRQLPQEIQEVLNKKKPMPPSLKAALEWTERDPTVYLTMNGPNELHIVGSLKTWSVIYDLYKINVLTLLLNGRLDEAWGISCSSTEDSRNK